MVTGPGARVGIAVFARFDSRRLPGKVLAEIAGRPMLGHVLARVRRVTPTLPVFLATSDRRVDDPVASFGNAEGVTVFRGAADDVAGRCLALVETARLDALVRISGDSPFIDPAVIEEGVGLFLDRWSCGDLPDLVSNVFPRRWPPGISVEVVARTALAALCRSTDDNAHREHVTSGFYAVPRDWRIFSFGTGEPPSGIRLTVDTEEELEQARFIAGRLPDPSGASYEEVLECAYEWYSRKTGG